VLLGYLDIELGSKVLLIRSRWTVVLIMDIGVFLLRRDCWSGRRCCSMSCSCEELLQFFEQRTGPGQIGVGYRGGRVH
jgi:hypothetical protein